MKYFILDIDDFILLTIESDLLPPNSVVADIDIGEAPGIGYLYHYPTKQWVEHPNLLRSFSLNKQARLQRDNLLQQSDWTQIPNGPLTTEQQTAWATYRQELRDITTQSGYPFNVIWPTPPI